jgi:hypothetical protein
MIGIYDLPRQLSIDPARVGAKWFLVALMLFSRLPHFTWHAASVKPELADNRQD